MGDSGGAALYLSQPYVTVYYDPVTVMSTKPPLLDGNGTSERGILKINVNFSRSTHGAGLKKNAAVSEAEPSLVGTLPFGEE